MANSPSGESVIDRLVRILESFDVGRAAQKPAEIARRAGLPRSTGHRLVGELVEHGLLERDASGEVRIGMRLWELTTRGSRALELRRIALPVMAQVQARVREHTQLAVREGVSALFIERLSGAESGANVTRIAGRLPLHASSSGLVLLAWAPEEVVAEVLAGPLEPLAPATITDAAALRAKLAEVRRLGVAIAPGYVEEVSLGVAVPVRDDRGEVVAALSAVLPSGFERADAVAEVLRRGAERIAEGLRERPGAAG